MRKKKPFRVLEERLKSNHIIIQLFKRRKVFSFGLSTFIGDGGMGHPEQGTYRSYFEAKNAALHHVISQIPPAKPGACFVNRSKRFV
jgi:hypothetical protein